jgi:hypothetical protein
MQLDFSSDGWLLPILVAAAIAAFTWFMRGQGAPAAVTDPFDKLSADMLALAKARADATKREEFKTAAVEAMEKVLPPDPAATKGKT